MSNNNQCVPAKSAIVGIAGHVLSDQEIELFQKYPPIGYILFGRNYKNKSQLQQLIEQLKNTSNQDNLLILIDQEGDKVSRLKEPDCTVLKNAVDYGRDAIMDLEKTASKLKNDFALVGKELKDMGINVNCAPVADLYYEDADEIIGVRSYGHDPEIVAALCNAVDQGLASSGVQSVIKHTPGHGRAMVDSHKALPIVDTDLETLLVTDFKVFKLLKHVKIAMAAHVVYTALDPIKPVTISKDSINFIRNSIGYRNILITDALEMRALNGNPGDLTKQAIEAGFDIVLYCEPKLDSIEEVLENAPCVSQDLISKIKDLHAFNKSLESKNHTS